MSGVFGCRARPTCCAVKIGTKQNSSCPSTQPTPYHQDAMDVPIDRNGYTGFWIALDHVTVNMGGMRSRKPLACALGCWGSSTSTRRIRSCDMTVTEVDRARARWRDGHTMYTIHGTGRERATSPVGRDRRLHRRGRHVHRRVARGAGRPWRERAAAELQSGDRFRRHAAEAAIIGVVVIHGAMGMSADVPSRGKLAGGCESSRGGADAFFRGSDDHVCWARQ